jgi:hypothetical protein
MSSIEREGEGKMKAKATDETQVGKLGKIDRRRFLGTLGAGVAAFGGSGLLGSSSALAQRFVIREENFGRMFPQLNAFFGDNVPRGLNELLVKFGARGGPLDANDRLPASASAADQAQAAINLIVDPALNVNNPNNTTHTAGTTFMGQFMDHDMTFDQTSALGEETEPEDSRNTRSPTLDLDSVYSGGPNRSPQLYGHEGSRIKLKVGFGGLFEDLPRDSRGVAILGDPRNDENIMLAGLHAAVLLFHNKAVDHVKARDRRADDDEVFARSQRLTRWHYQWMIVHEFLPLFIGQALTNRILNGRRFYRPRTAFMPVEFQGAAYRFGHTMIRPSYRANRVGNPGTNPGAPAFFGMIFDPAGQGQADPVDLRGGVRQPRRFVGWETFFDFGLQEFNGSGPAVKPNKIIDARISTPLFLLPIQTIAGFDPDMPTPISLPARNLLRGVTWSLPSGQSIARAIGADPLDPSELPQFPSDFRLNRSTPLWPYCLQEGLVRAKGLTLGPVGGTIVGEVIVGLLELDRNSYLNADRDWRPSLPQRDGRVTGNFRMVDFLTFAGVQPTPARGG